MMCATTTSAAKNEDSSIPVLDLSPEKDEAALAKELADTFKTTGFATLINHGVAAATMEKGFAASRSFFSLPIEIKRKYRYQSHASNRGYIQPGSENHKTTGVADNQKETFDIGKEGEDGYTTPWPEELADKGFKEDLLHYFQEFDRLNLRLMKLLAIGLGLPDPGYFVDRCNDQHCNLRLLHYLEINREEKGQTIHRGARHTDYGSITLLAQDMVGGLRVQSLDGKWTHVKPVKGSIIVNIGEMMQRLTNDVLIADPHQVVDLPSYEDMVPERYSIAFFCNVNKHVMLEPLTILNGEPAKYPPIKAHDYITERLSSTISK